MRDYLTGHDEGEYFAIKNYKKVSFFPKKFPEVKFGKVYKDQQLKVPSYLVHRLRDGQHSYFDLDKKYDFLKQRDIIGLPNPEAQNGDKIYAEIMYQRRAKVSDLLKSDPRYEWQVEQQISRKVQPEEEINLLQLKKVYDFQFENISS